MQRLSLSECRFKVTRRENLMGSDRVRGSLMLPLTLAVLGCYLLISYHIAVRVLSLWMEKAALKEINPATVDICSTTAE